MLSLVYGVEIVVPVKIMVPSARLAIPSKLFDPYNQIYDAEALKKRRRLRNKQVRLGTLNVGGLVLKIAWNMLKELSAPYVNTEAYDSDKSMIFKPDFRNLLPPVNVKWLKLYTFREELKNLM